MNPNELSGLTDGELLKEHESARLARSHSIIIMLLLLGIAAFFTLRFGIGLFTFLLPVYVFILIGKMRTVRILEREMKARRLK